MEQQHFDMIIIGAGPAGIFAALQMTKKRPESRILIVDTGRAISNRACPARLNGQCLHCDPCAIVHGWAGAGAFSDGKLSLSDEVGGHVSDYIGHKRAMEYIAEADQEYLRFGASKTVHGLNNTRVDEIAYEASRHNIRLVPCPVRHLGTENAGPVLGAMHDYLVSQTHTVFMELTNAEDILSEDGKVVGVKIQQRGKEPQVMYAPYVVAAPGRGGAQWLSEAVGKLGLRTQNN
ncbi:MAG: FAD-dependent oxidoreductase, partial [Clostridia bacterium]